METDEQDAQLALIKKRYAMDQFNIVHTVPDHILIDNLRAVIEPEEFKGKDLLEIGAGCSLYLKLFLEFGCRRLVGNDLIEKRLKLNKIDDPRYEPMPGDFLKAPIENDSFDIVFAHLTMMFVVPMFDQFLARAYSILRPGGSLVTFDANYLCPISLYRRYADRSGANPARLFSAFDLKRRAIRQGFEEVALVPMTTNRQWMKGNWFLGTSFWMRAVKPHSGHAMIEP